MDNTTYAFSIVQLTTNVPQIKTGAVILVFIAFDIVTGLIKSLSQHDYKSSVMRIGLIHKLAELICFLFGVVCDLVLPYIGVTVPFSIASAICIYIVVMEIGSVTENIGVINPELGQRLHKIFANFEKEGQNNDSAGNFDTYFGGLYEGGNLGIDELDDPTSAGDDSNPATAGDDSNPATAGDSDGNPAPAGEPR